LIGDPESAIIVVAADNYSDQRSLIVIASALKQGLFYCPPILHHLSQ